MRPQQNRRMRGRGNGGNNNNRKGPNPLTRSYESNGPDVKIRGSAQQIAEKYTTLARDAQSAGDRVMAENYLQHAEHYNRIIMAAQAQMPQQQARDMREDEDDEEGDDGFAPVVSEQPAREQPGREQPAREQQARQPREPRANGTGPQPVIEGIPAEVALEEDTLGQAKAPAAAGEEAPAGEAPGADAEAAPRRTRRPRRPRVKADEENAAGEAQASGSDEPVVEAAQ